MTKEFVPYQPSLEMKSLGFNEPCLGAHGPWGFMPPNDVNSLSDDVRQEDLDNQWSDEDGVCLAPTFSQAFRWFREKYNLQCWVEPTGSDRYSCRYDGNDETGYRWVGYLRDINHEILYYSNPEEAEFECLNKLIEIVKKK